MKLMSNFFSNKTKAEVNLRFWWDDGIGSVDSVVKTMYLSEIYAMDKREQEIFLESLIPESAIYSGVKIEEMPENIELKKTKLDKINPAFQDLYELEDSVF